MKITDEIPTLSIVVTVYNIENYIKECLDSILCQDYTDYEMIIIDDGSTDSSGDICDSYAGEHVRVIHTENRGVSDARNAGIDVSRGKYILFVDGDDVMIRGHLKKIMLKVVDSDAPVTIFHIDAFDNVTGEPIRLDYGYNAGIIRTGTKPEIVEELLCHECTAWSPETNVFSSDFIRHNRLRFRTEAYGVEDCRFYLDAVRVCNSFAYTAISLMKYRQNRSGSIMQTPNLIKLEARARTYSEWIDYANELIAYNGHGDRIRRRMGDLFFYNVMQMYTSQSDEIFFGIVDNHRDILKYAGGIKKQIFYRLVCFFGAKTALRLVVRGKYKRGN